MREAAKSCGKLLKAVKTCGREHEKGGKEKPDAFSAPGAVWKLISFLPARRHGYS